ncbi:MAG TPA: CBS domain-containing protein [Halothiobacillus sp.]|nr:CBS domain-containing protein [Halothiobacillus sp.]
MAELRIESVMTRNPITVSGNTPLSEAQAIMISRGLRHLPVIEDGKVVGVISDRDILLAQLAHEGLDNRNALRVSDISTLSVFAVSPQSPLADVVEEMARRHIGSALVMEGDTLLGIFTATDACRQLARILRNKS